MASVAAATTNTTHAASQWLPMSISQNRKTARTSRLSVMMFGRLSADGARGWSASAARRSAAAPGVNKNLDLVTDERIPEFESDLLLQFHQPVAAGVFHIVGKMPIELDGRRPRLERIREDPHSLEPSGFDKFAQLVELRLGLTGK